MRPNIKLINSREILFLALAAFLVASDVRAWPHLVTGVCPCAKAASGGSALEAIKHFIGWTVFDIYRSVDVNLLFSQRDSPRFAGLSGNDASLASAEHEDAAENARKDPK